MFWKTKLKVFLGLLNTLFFMLKIAVILKRFVLYTDNTVLFRTQCSQISTIYYSTAYCDRCTAKLFLINHYFDLNRHCVCFWLLWLNSFCIQCKTEGLPPYASSISFARSIKRFVVTKNDLALLWSIISNYESRRLLKAACDQWKREAVEHDMKLEDMSVAFITYV